MTTEELQDRLVELNSQANDIRAKADAEKRDLTTEEAGQLDQLLAAFDATRRQINSLNKLAEQTEDLSRGTGRRTEPDAPRGGPDDDDDSGDYPPPPRRQPPGQVDKTAAHRNAPPGSYLPAQLRPKNGGFRTLGEMGVAVIRAARSLREGGGNIDPRLQHLASPSTYGNEASGADGGFAVPPDFRTSIMEKVMAEDSILARCDQITVAGNNFTFPVDETTPWQTSGGIQAYWGGEGEVKAQSKPAIDERSVKLNKIYALIPMTDELLEDASAMDAYLRRKAPEKIRYKVDEAILQGNGVGKPLGVLNSPALVTVTKESGQQADTIVGNNILKIYSRMYSPNRGRAVWFVNQDIEGQLYKLSVPGTDNTGNAVTGWGGMLYMPPGGLSQAPYGTLMGRPVVPTQALETLGDKGDILFADMSQYLAILKSGPNPKVDVSIHLWFDQDMTAFRFVLRVGGLPWWGSSIAARDGSTTYSAYVTLEERG